MDLEADLHLNLAADGLDNLILESAIDFLLVVVNGYVRLLQVLHIPQHIQRVACCEKEVVQLVGPFRILHNKVENMWEEGADPVDESAARALAHYLLPISHSLKKMAKVTDLTVLLGSEDLVRHHVEAVVHDGGPHEIVTTLMSIENGGEEVHHVFIELAMSELLACAMDALLQHVVDDLARVPVDEGHPLIYNEALGAELDLDGFQHFNAAYDVMESR
mmetsp:Transcript_20692/g.31693  ORF Transcript_20692/g.31693 Transcript_20692/m.31693 type:complete len:219 (+) Transcript_20692:828-1484(+)